jgi:predicted DNA-binding helix-hairpin-helix protein
MTLTGTPILALRTAVRYHRVMNIRAVSASQEKLEALEDATRFEPAGDNPITEGRPSRGKPLPCITDVSTPGGKKPILKGMLTTACEKDCYYCPFRAGRSSTRRVTFQPDEMARTFDQMQRTGLADGIFLSSGIIKGGVSTQDKIIDTIEIIRKRYQYQGFVHLKIMPGAEYDQLYRAMQLADRVSLNLEGPSQERLNVLAPKKDFAGELLERLAWAEQIRQQSGGQIRASTTTQFVVGAAGDTDLELLSLSARLYRQMGLRRAYYSAFEPILDTPFENLALTPKLRELRLYQSSFLLRDYAWELEDLPFLDAGNLPLDTDPKRAWADSHLLHAPIDIMHASPQELLRIPGIGPRGVEAIVQARLQGHLSDLAHLRAIGIRAPEKAAPYILLDGRQLPRQLSLF